MRRFLLALTLFLLALTLVIAASGCSGPREPTPAAPAASEQHTDPAPFPLSTAPPTVAGDDSSICAHPNLRTFLNEVEKYAGRAGLDPDAPLRDWESTLEQVRYIAMGTVGSPLGDAAAGLEGYLSAVEGHLDARFSSPEARNYAHVIAKAATRIARTCGVDVDITIPDKPKLSQLGLSRTDPAARAQPVPDPPARETASA
ncbi:hypothetical protein [Streptosporangium roseum]|uniref:Lipoprotein n=1 Tax=Streptosporangium roseum (strain ATCC 12428 / DSM 43021 / JCM 3005 / KCTC 9067 / NCIMB 10171 / NRRL 2505 / NI 9100) TaxID=479432 RepID=D2B443_STRRD|nr:hypothetical protein [Streptosporangium roseum]ACZ91277.1 hypothetical protein Sros_8635 [Streptosporangium roseum DSM 43021]